MKTIPLSEVLTAPEGRSSVIRIETREIVSPSDAAKRVGISTRRLLQLVAAGRLPAIVDSCGRRTFRVEDIERLLEERQARKVTHAA